MYVLYISFICAMYYVHMYMYIYMYVNVLILPRTYQNDSEDIHLRFSAVNNMEHIMRESICPWHFPVDRSSIMEVSFVEEDGKDA